MNRHQVLTGAANAGDHCYSVGSVEGVPFTAYASGCNIVILASNFQRIQIIPGLIHGNVQVGCLDASTDVGKIAAAYGREVCIYEPTPLLHQSSNHRLDYQWVQTAVIKSEFQLQVLSWNLSGTRLLTGGSNIQLWQLSIAGEEDIIEEEPTNIQVKCTGDDGVVTDIDEQCKWNCIWSCRTAQSVAFLKFSPDGTLFASAGSADRLVKIWYSSKIVSFSSQNHSGHSGALNYTFIYIAHPRAVSGLSWRKTSKFMPNAANGAEVAPIKIANLRITSAALAIFIGATSAALAIFIGATSAALAILIGAGGVNTDSVANMLLTSCRDNICRIWVQSLMPEDGLVDLQQIDSIANQNLRVQTQRHRKKIMQRLKHMKSFNQLKKHQASQFTEDPLEPVSILPSTYSVHDFHCFGMQGSGVTPSLHFHLAGTIDAKADIPLVPSLVGSHTKDPNFVVHWMNNKEMAFTHAAEHLLQDVSDKVLQLQHKRDMAYLDHDSDKLNSENKVVNGRRGSHPKSESSENINEPLASKQNSPSASSSTSIATDSSASQSQSVSGDFIDRKIEKLLRDWHRSQDLLFSVYPADGSFLVWSVDWLDEYHPGSFRQAIVNFASRIPNAVPLGDAATMSHNIFMYSPHAGLDLRLAISAAVSEQMIKDKAGKTEDGDAQQPPDLDYAQWKHNCNKQLSQYCALSSTTPTVCMLTKHSNGSLNLWHVSFADTSPYTQVLSIGHFTRVCGHRFRINDVTCHPVLPLLLTTSHHNLPGKNQNNSNPSSPAAPLSPRCCLTPFMGLQSGFCSELILWKVDPVGPLSKSGGVTELARINSPETAAFANVAWIPTLLPSTTQGSISNSPSACFVASDGHQLRVYQAVIDARTLLAEISSSSRRKNSQDMSQSTSTSSGLGYKHSTLQDTFRIISEQSTSRPGCVIELDAISDATHDWQNTQLLHVFQEQLISSSPHRRNTKEASNISLVQPDLQAIVDLRHSSVFEEPFYLVVLEKQEEKSVLHMWKIIIASPFGAEDHEHQSFSYVPDSNLVQESDHSNQSSRSMSPDHNHDASYPLSQVSPLRITTVKVCTQVMPLPEDVEIVHATPAAGHLSSSNIYPACFAPYLICTACSDYTVRFWKCEILETGNKDDVEYNWVEWEMMLNKSPSSVRVSGQPLFVSCAYSGRMACAFKHGKSFTRHNSKNPESRFVNIGVSIFECESTGGSEWMLEDTINLRNVSLPVPKLSLNLESLVDASQRNKRTADTLLQKLSTDETANERLPFQRLLSVPSYATLQTLRQAITEKGNQDLLAPKSLVQLDWVSAEDGSHILTVAIGSKVLLFTPVSNDIAQANVQAMKASKSASRPLLKQASSMVLPLSCNDEIRWMRIRSTPLKTADSLPPIPMQLSWVRHGILVVGMDSEMHIYSQWRVPVCNDRGQAPESEKDEPLVDDRKLTEEELLTRAQESSQLRLPTTSGTLSRSTSSNVLTAAAETKRKKSEVAKPQRESIASVGPMPDFGLFEASRLACPILPQYHPKQLMELLGFGKLRRVKAILSHLVRCLSGSENIKKTYLQVPESVGNEDEGDETTRTWSRTRAMSMAASSSPLPHSPNDQRGSVSVFPEEVTLDYVEIQSIPPLPLFTLIAADKESNSQPVQSTQDEALDQDYSGLFDVSMHMEDSLDDILHSKSVSGENKRERPSFSGNERKVNLTNFSPNQAASLTHFLTHSHLPGLSSLDQMHLLALADTVASFNTALSDRFGAEPVVSKGPNKTNVEGLNVTVTTDSLDDCGLRFLLAVRHYVYLTLCLPLSQRAQLQNQGLGSHSLVWAFHSETQEELLQLIPCMQKGTLKWCELRELGVGWWVRSNAVLRRLMEKVAKAAFQAKNDPLDAALYYLAMKKKTLLWGLFRSVSDTKMTAFFQNNFTQDKWKKSAMKNAYVLMGKQRFEHAAAFFLLGGDLKVAVEIILNHLNDLQLAMVVIRLYEGEIETVTPSLKKLLFVEVLGCEPDGTNYIPSKAYPDPFIRCMARWILQDYCGSLTTLLQTDVGYSHPKASEIENSGDRISANPSVFNFYLFLRTHPLVVRRQRAQNLFELKKSKAAGRQNFRSESLDVEEAPFEDTITPLERRLFFTTAHAHFRAGCPALALEVLSRLPNRVLTDGPMSPDDAVFDFANVMNEGDNVIATGLVSQDSISQATNKNMDWGQPVAASKGGGSAADLDWSQPVKPKTEETLDFDWGAPVTQLKEPELELDFGLNNSENEASEEEDGIEIKAPPEEPVKEEVRNDSRSIAIDIMAQQLKFIACLKIMMEELSTLATGYEVDGGQLRYQLYIWLEKSVSALKDLCLYGASSQDYDEAVNEESMAMDGSSHSNANWDSAVDFSNQRASLHEILLADKLDFEAKLQRSSRRKQWLKANEALLRTLLSYCSLHGAHGGGLAAVRMELILLLHELQQERSRQQLLSPLPFPTTLPLLAASVACQKTVVADPIRHLQSLVHDILLTIIDMTDPPAVSNASFSHLIVLRDLSTSLSACIYESLCDSDTFVVKQGGARGLSMEELISSGVVYQNSHLLAGHVNRIRHSSGEEDVKATTSPHKWPGVSSLRALLAQDKDEDSPKLHTLLCEAFVSVYVSQLIYALSTCDCHVLYRLVGQYFSKETWSLLFGGGAKILLHISTNTNSVETSGSPASLEKESQSQSLSERSESGSGILDSLSRQRIKFHMKLLGQSGQQTTQPAIKEDKPTYREQFIPPKMSMVSLFMSKPKLVSEWDALDYDSNASLPSDEEEVEEGDMDDVFGGESTEEGQQVSSGRKKITSDSGLDQLDPSSYTWGILRYAVVKLARLHIATFLSIAGLEMQDLPVVSPLIHSVLKCMDFWIKDLKQYMDSFESPPPNFIPGCSSSGPQMGPAVLKYSALLDLHNTPFRSNHRAVLPVKRLWNYLVRQETVQDVFIRYIYQFKRVTKTDDFDIDTPAEANSANLNSVRVIHKDQDTINTFCINRVKNGIIALATPKEIQEIDMSVLLQPIPWLREEAEFEAVNLLRAPDTLPSTDYLVIQHPADSLQANQSSSGSTPTTSGPTSSIGVSKNMKGLNFPGCTNPQFCQLVLQRSRYMLKPLKKHKIDGVRKLTSHPLMPVYLSGSQDGSVSLWEWNHAQPISSPRQAGTFAKVTKIAFNLQGNKFGVTDGDGIISLWQVGLGSVSNKPFFSTQCHSKQANDFAFLSSSSLIATAGHSTDNRNVCLWDTLLPQGKSLIASFQCHDGGCSSLVYAPQSHTLISAGKKGDICIFDVRQNKLKQKFQAHESPIKCLALDPAEEFFATGSADGDIKVWGLSVHVKLCTFNGEHTKSSLFRSINNGVSQMEIDEMGRLFSCGADGSLKFRTLPDNDIVNVL